MAKAAIPQFDTVAFWTYQNGDKPFIQDRVQVGNSKYPSTRFMGQDTFTVTSIRRDGITLKEFPGELYYAYMFKKVGTLLTQ
jgi:hypothetical protein